MDERKQIHNESLAYNPHKAFLQVYPLPPGWVNFLVGKQGTPPSVFAPLDVGVESRGRRGSGAFLSFLLEAVTFEGNAAAFNLLSP